jgi:hypothetical protein
VRRRRVDRVDRQRLQNIHVRRDHVRIFAIVAAADRKHIRRRQERPRRERRRRKAHGVRPEPRLVFHHDDMAGAVDDERRAGAAGRTKLDVIGTGRRISRESEHHRDREGARPTFR